VRENRGQVREVKLVLENIEIDTSVEPHDNYKKAKIEILKSLIDNKCSLSAFQYIVNEIIKEIVNNNEIQPYKKG